MTHKLAACATRRGGIVGMHHSGTAFRSVIPTAAEECQFGIRRHDYSKQLSSSAYQCGSVASSWCVASRAYSTDSHPPSTSVPTPTSTSAETDELFAMMEEEEAFVPVESSSEGKRVPFQFQSRNASSRPQASDDVIASAMKEYQASALRHELNKNEGEESDAQQEEQRHEWRPRFRTLRLHGMPRYWMHEDIVNFVDLVAEQAEIPIPEHAEHEHESWNSHGDVNPTSSAVPAARSPFISRLKVPYGRRTGLLYGSPEIELTSSRLVDHLLKRLVFEPDDYRSRISFSEIPLHELKRRWDAQEEKAARLRHMSRSLAGGEEDGGRNTTEDTSDDWMLSEEEELKLEQQYVLENLELDRYLLAPDLLYDLAKMQQRRLITRSGKVILPAFRDTYDKDSKAAAGEIGLDEPLVAPSRRKGSSKQRRRIKANVRADENPELGRGSPQNMAIQKPYVHGRPGL